MKKYKNIKNIILILFSITLVVLSIIATICVCKQTSKLNYYKAVSNPPLKNYVEEDLEDVFMTNFVVVVNTEYHYDDAICYVVKVDNYKNDKQDYYLVNYILKKINKLVCYDYKWEYNSNRLIYSE